MTFDEIKAAINSAFRDYVTEGLPVSGAHEPVKSEIRAALALLAIALDDGGFSEPPDWASDLAAVVAQLEGIDAVIAAGVADAVSLATAAAEGAVTGLPKVLAALGGDLSDMFTTEKGDETLDSATFPDGDYGQAHPDAFGTSGILAQVGVNVSASGTARLLTLNSSTEKVTWFADVTLASGINLLTAGSDFPFRYVEAGETLLFYQTSGGNMRTGAAAAGPQEYFSFVGAPDVGDAISSGAFLSWTAPFAFSYKLVSVEDPDSDPLPEIRSRTLAVSEHFAGTSTPANWTKGSCFSVNDGLVSTGTGGWDNYATHASYSNVTQREVAARVTFSDATSKWALATRPDPTSPAPYHGGVLVIDGSTNKIGLYAWDVGTPTGYLLAEASMPTLATGTSYIPRAHANDQAVFGELVDATGEVVASVSADNFMTSGHSVAFKGGLTAIHFSGDVKADWIEAYQLYPRRLKLLIIGDSNHAGDVTPAIGTTWPMRLTSLRPQKDIMLSAAGGDVGQWLNRLPQDLDLFQPEKALFLSATNYSSQATWRTDVKAFIAAAVAAGAEPVLSTVIPRTGSQTLRDAQNADILSGYFGDLRFVDIAAAITDGGDRQTWHAPGADNGDGIHLSMGGQIMAFEYVRDDCPWLWRDEPNAFLV